MFRLNQTEAFKTIFSILWYEKLPCFDVSGITADKENEKSILKSCKWKGVNIPCSKIFTTFPTDRGMCCSFNIAAAEDIFVESTYTKQLKYMQACDKRSALGSDTMPKSYYQNKEPKTSPGRNKGLVLILDSHTDLLSPGSVDTNFNGFMGLINPTDSFPSMIQEGFEIKAGYNNIVSLTATKVDADDDMRNLALSDRNCLFPDENVDMKIFKKYSYQNCMFECSLYYGLKMNNDTCLPWFLPSTNATITICDPWQAQKFLQVMVTEIPDELCIHCLPDCRNIIYEPTVSAVPFSKCGFTNLGVSYLCNLNYDTLPQPTKFSYDLIKELTASSENNVPPDYALKYESYARTLPIADYFKTNNKLYDYYASDIAMVEVFFRKSTIVQMGSQPRMTWIDYLSTVGGLMGLVLGMGIVSVVEVIWLCMRLVARKCNLSYMVP